MTRAAHSMPAATPMITPIQMFLPSSNFFHWLLEAPACNRASQRQHHMQQKPYALTPSQHTANRFHQHRIKVSVQMIACHVLLCQCMHAAYVLIRRSSQGRKWCSPVCTMKTPITKKVNPTRNGRAMHPLLKLLLRRSTNVRTPRNKIDVAMKANMGDTNHDRIIGTIPCMSASCCQ